MANADINELREKGMAHRTKSKHNPRELMELAVAEGDHSIPEHTNKEDPFVGAIIATMDGEILGKSHRGELRVGEHCEFTLLERKLRDRDLTDCVLYGNYSAIAGT